MHADSTTTARCVLHCLDGVVQTVLPLRGPVRQQPARTVPVQPRGDSQHGQRRRLQRRGTDCNVQRALPQTGGVLQPVSGTVPGRVTTCMTTACVLCMSYAYALHTLYNN